MGRSRERDHLDRIGAGVQVGCKERLQLCHIHPAKSKVQFLLSGEFEHTRDIRVVASREEEDKLLRFDPLNESAHFLYHSVSLECQDGQVDLTLSDVHDSVHEFYHGTSGVGFLVLYKGTLSDKDGPFGC